MAIRRRYHSHSRKEWEEIRPQFTELYQVQRKKLSEIVDILARDGFKAKECHYKTYIRKWHLDRKNKVIDFRFAAKQTNLGFQESDMIFAHQKLQNRQDKDTSFIIRGQTRDRKDVEHYWERRGVDPAQFSPVVQTPQNVEYRTPSPALGGDYIVVELARRSQSRYKRTPRSPWTCLTCHSRRVKCDGKRPECLRCQTSGRKCAGYEDPLPGYTWPRRSELYLASAEQAILAGSSTGTDELRPETLCEFADNFIDCFDFSTRQRGLSPVDHIDFDTGLSPRPGAIRPMSVLEPYASQEQAIHHIRAYFQSCVERATFETNHDQGNEELQTMDDLRAKTLDLLWAIRTGLPQAIVGAARFEMFTLLPKIAQFDRPYLMTALLQMVGEIARAAREENSSAISMLNGELVGEIARLRIGTHPVVLTLQAITRFSGIMDEVLERLLLAGKDILAQGFGYQHLDTREVLLAASIASEYSGHLNTALKSAKEVYQTDLSRHRAAATDENLSFLVDSQESVIKCHRKLGNLAEAQELVKDGLASCCHAMSRRIRDEARSRLFFQQGVIKWMCGQLTAAEQSFTEALTLRLSLYGAGDYYTMIIASWLEGLLREQKRVSTESVSPARLDYQVGKGYSLVDEEFFPAPEQASYIVAEDEEMVDCEADQVFEEATRPVIVGGPEDFTSRVIDPRATATIVQLREEHPDQHVFETCGGGVEETWYDPEEHFWESTGEESSMMDLN